MRVALCYLRFQTASAMRQERGNLVCYYSELNLNQYSVGSPCRTICTVFGSPPCPDLNLIHYIVWKTAVLIPAVSKRWKSNISTLKRPSEKHTPE